VQHIVAVPVGLHDIARLHQLVDLQRDTSWIEIDITRDACRPK
jgi:hypothetical protein